MPYAYDITPKGWTVSMRYHDDNAELTIRCDGITAVLEEWECDNLLRVVECAQDPIEDLDEFFEDDFPRTHYRVAVCFNDYASAIAKHVYVA